MRIAIAEISQETDTFSPILTTLKSFQEGGLYYGEQALEESRGVGKLGGFLDVVAEQEEDVELLPIMRAWATPGGRLTDEALAFLQARLLSGLRQVLPVDAVFLSLHGAASAVSTDDLEGGVLRAVRDVVGKDVPIVVPLDHHANITQQIMDMADVVTGYQTQPHDRFETGQRTARILFNLLAGKFSPTVGWFKIPMVSPQDKFLTSGGPMKEWFDLAREIEQRPNVITASTFPMQPWLDVEDAGWAAMVYTDGDPALARELAAELANKAWELRAEFWVSERVSPAEAIRQADQAIEGLIILSDTGDAVGGGAPGESTWLLRQMLEQRITSTAFLPLIDAEAVESAIQAGEGSEITLSLGGKIDRIFNQPVEVTGRVARISQGFVVWLETYGTTNLGNTVLFEVGSIKIVLADRRLSAVNNPIMYTHLGLKMEDAKMVVAKTGSNFQYFAPWRKALIRVDTPGITQSNLHAFDWVRATHPIYPIDDLPKWQARP